MCHLCIHNQSIRYKRFLLIISHYMYLYYNSVCLSVHPYVCFVFSLCFVVGIQFMNICTSQSAFVQHSGSPIHSWSTQLPQGLTFSPQAAPFLHPSTQVPSSPMSSMWQEAFPQSQYSLSWQWVSILQYGVQIISPLALNEKIYGEFMKIIYYCWLFV